MRIAPKIAALTLAVGLPLLAPRPAEAWLHGHCHAVYMVPTAGYAPVGAAQGYGASTYGYALHPYGYVPTPYAVATHPYGMAVNPYAANPNPYAVSPQGLDLAGLGGDALGALSALGRVADAIRSGGGGYGGLNQYGGGGARPGGGLVQYGGGAPAPAPVPAAGGNPLVIHVIVHEGDPVTSGDAAIEKKVAALKGELDEVKNSLKDVTEILKAAKASGKL